jgi:hypothetical protein
LDNQPEIRADIGEDFAAPRAREKHRSSVTRVENKRLAHALLHWARVAVQHDPASRAKYRDLRARGKSWGRALRGVADRLLYVACAALRSRTLYNPEFANKKSAC